MDDSCAVCAESLEWVAYGSCAHREVCSTCVLRLRFIFNDRRCCICKTECPLVFVTKALGDYTKTISDFSSFGLELKEGRVGSFWYHEETKVLFDDLEEYIRIKTMCRLSCGPCDKTKKGFKNRVRIKSVEHLKKHLEDQHQLQMCGLCLVGRKVFICEQKLFTKTQLDRHISSGDSEVDGSESERGGFTGHPMCEFCKSPFYGDNELYTHMSREHYTCHICQRLKPGQYVYYGNYDDLEVHFRSDHFLCEDESCLAKKFIVFQIEAELKRHNATDHGGRMSWSQQSASLQIQASFQYPNSRRGRGRSSRHQPNLAVLESQASYDPLLQPVGGSGGSRHGESSFPPLSVQPNHGQTRSGQNAEGLLSNTSTTRVRHQTNRSATTGSSRAWPALHRGPRQASVTSGRNSASAWPIQSSSASAPSQSWHHGRSEITRTPASAIQQDARSEHITAGGSSAGASLSSSNSKRNNHHTNSTPKMSGTRSLEQPPHSDSPPVCTKSSSASAKASNIQVAEGASDVQSANKSLVEKVHASLGHNNELFMAFKDTSGKYRRGSIDARTYLEHVKGYGLSHLVLDIARLCPDPKRQKELIDTHNACMRGENDTVENSCTLQRSSQAKESCGLKKDKGKAVKVESSSDSTGDKLQFSDKSHDAYRPDKGKTKVTTLVDSSSAVVGFGKKTPKFLRARLGEKSMTAAQDLKSSNPEPEPESKNDNSKRSQNSTSGLPLRGAWRRGSAKLFL